MFEIIQHVNIVVDDLAAARHFYGELLALPAAQRPDFGFPGLWYQVGATQLHITLAGEPPPRGLHHFALQTRDLDAIVRRLEAADVVVVRLPGAIPGAGHQAFVHDPAGNQVEFNQPE